MSAAQSFLILETTSAFECQRFSPAATPHLRERCWHPTQTIDLTSDGGCILRVRVSEPMEMQPWIRSWGAQVEVLAPDWLRERVADELRRASDQYWLAPHDEGIDTSDPAIETADRRIDTTDPAIEPNDPAGDPDGSTERSSPPD